MLEFYKVYVKSSSSPYKKNIGKTVEEVQEILNNAKREGYTEYLIIKQIPPKTDVIIGSGNLKKGEKTRLPKSINTDWRVVGQNVVDWEKYQESRKSKECKVVFTDLEPEEKIKYASLQVTKDGKIKWNRPKGKEKTEKASQEYVDR